MPHAASGGARPPEKGAPAVLHASAAVLRTAWQAAEQAVALLQPVWLYTI